MSRTKLFVRICCLLMAVCMLFSGCGNAPPAPEPQLISRVHHEPVRFDELEYLRPDTGAMDADISRALELTISGDGDAALALYDEILRNFSHLDTMSSLASIRYNMDLEDTLYQQEELALDEASVQLDNRMLELTGAILDSDFAEKAEARWGDAFIERYEFNRKLNSPEIEPLAAEEQKLVSEYQQLSAKEYTALRNGKPVTIDDLDFSVEDDIYLYFEICEKRNAELGEIYLQLVKLRMEIAHTLGYESYTDYAYDCLGRDFSKEDAASFSKK